MNALWGSRPYLHMLALLAITLVAAGGCQNTPSANTPASIQPTEAGAMRPSAAPVGTSATSELIPTSTVAPTVAPAVPSQVIVIETPPPGTIVGSPVVLTGRMSAVPPDGSLSYRVRDSAGAQIGAGGLQAQPDASGQGGVFTSSLTFTEPPGGGGIQVEIYQSGSGGSVIATATITLTVAPSQLIVIETPPPQTIVGSPLVITGRTARYPFQGQLSYRILNEGNQQIGDGSFPISGSPGGPASFTASIVFGEPPGGGRIRIELIDRQAGTNLVAASVAIDLTVAPPQAIIFDTPAAGTLVGSPVVITGRTARHPFQGNLTYRFLSAAGDVLGTGLIVVNGSPGQPGSFNASLLFNLPPNGGDIRFELADQDANTGIVAASAILALRVAPPATAVPSPIIITPTPTRVRPVSPTSTATSRPCSAFSCDGDDDVPLAIAPGGPNDPSFAPCQAQRNQPWIDSMQPLVVELGQQRYFYACDFPTAPLSASLVQSDGAQQSIALHTALLNPDLQPGRATAFVSWPALPTTATGVYTLTVAAENSATAQIAFLVVRPPQERIVVVPQSGPPGTAFQVYLVGFQLNSTVTLDLFGEDSPAIGSEHILSQRSRLQARIDQPLAGASGRGWAQLTLQSAASDMPAAYAITYDNRRVTTLFWIR